MINKPLQEITQADLQRLIDEKINESKTLEYKQELPGNSDGGPVKILRSISSLSNTAGGDLLYGVAADEGIPVGLPGIATASQDEVVLRMESLCRNGLDPRLPHIEFHCVPVADDKVVLVVRVKRSWSAPHRVTTGGHSHFYGRNAAGAYQLDVGELRAAFNLSESVAERIRAFRASRMLAIAEGEGPVPLLDGAKVILHLVPLSAFASSELPVSFQAHQQQLLQLSPIGASGWDSKYVLEGYVSFTGNGAMPARACTLTYRSGIVEAVATFTRRNEEAHIHAGYEGLILEAFAKYSKALEAIGVEYPIYALLSFVGTQGYSISHSYYQYGVVTKNSISARETVVPDSSLPPYQIFKDAFDTVANAFGLERSVNYDRDGNWTARN